MNIIIAGSGKVGTTLALRLASEGYDITLIDNDQQVLGEVCEQCDAMGVQGNCASMPVLLQAGIGEADLLIAATNEDEVNLLCCTTAHGLNPKLHTIARIRNPEYTQQIHALRDVFALSLAVNPEKQAATEIERLLRFPGFLHRDTFAKGRTAIVELRVDENSKLRDIPLSQLNGIVKCKVLVCAVLRDGSAVTPGGNFVLHAGDRIFVTAPTGNLSTLLKSLGIVTRRVRKVLLCGGGRVSHYLAEQLCKAGISVTLIERNHERCVHLAGMLPDATVIHGDATDRALLESQGLSDCDALVTMTGLDELNMIISLYGTTQEVPQVITKLSRVENRSVTNSLSLGSIICPRELCCDDIVRYVRAMEKQSGSAISVHSIADGQVEAIEFLVDGDTKHCGEALKDIKLRSDVLLVSITHGSVTQIPGGDSTFQKGDTIVVVTSGRGKLRQLNDIFA
ncbi:MAG: Trk system potassium transporter TrkA [Oscillospiraceae bacterium]|nr:Trk system potassium transporter TrkA [Oscillospiraceae bacterium]